MGQIGLYATALNKAINNRKAGFAAAFIAAAELTLTEDQFAELEIKAGEILMCVSNDDPDSTGNK